MKYGIVGMSWKVADTLKSEKVDKGVSESHIKDQLIFAQKMQN